MPADTTPRTSQDVQVPEYNRDGSLIEWKTPEKSVDVREHVRQITGFGALDPTTARTLLRSVAKSLDQKDFVITQQELRIKQLENRVVQLQPRKRKKVQTSPNSKFATIQDIIRAQIATGDREIVPLDSDDATTLVSTLSHIIIEE